MEYEEKIKNANSVDELFNIVKEIAGGYTGFERENIRIYFSNLGMYETRFVGAYYNYITNSITINITPLKNLQNRNPNLINFYLFHILLHEYIHALGVFNEWKTRKLAYDISRNYFGSNHILTRLAININQYMPEVIDAPHKPRDFSDEYEKVIYEFMSDIMKIFNHF